MAKLKDLTGQTFGYLTVLEQTGWEEKSWARLAMWRCKCVCGEEVTVAGKYLKGGKTRSCGCKRWQAKKRDILEGVQNVKASARTHYLMSKARALRLDKPFALTFEEFAALRGQPCSMCGYKEGPVSIDRIDSSAGYTQDNVQPLCRACQVIKSAFPQEFINRHIRRIVRHQDAQGRTVTQLYQQGAI